MFFKISFDGLGSNCTRAWVATGLQQKLKKQFNEQYFLKTYQNLKDLTRETFAYICANANIHTLLKMASFNGQHLLSKRFARFETARRFPLKLVMSCDVRSGYHGQPRCAEHCRAR